MEEFSPFDMDIAVQPDFTLPTDSIQPENIDPNLFHDAIEFNHPLLGQDQGGISETSASANSPSVTEIVNALNSPPSTQNSSPRPRQKCPNACYSVIHELNSTLDIITRDPGQTSLDEILMLFQRAFRQSAQYLACENCDAACPRHINLAMLHQRQVTLLCELAKTPEDHLSNDMTRASLGSFQPSKQDDLSIKQLMLRQATRNVKMSVEAHHEGAKEFERRHIEGTLELGDAGKLNLKWLLDISENLRRRLDCVRVLLERDDWAARLGE
ncbi:hypothetical protein F53441_7833 [Fusarium austroafricanum]|uniref:Aflatoxin regulatory protein domain-containing protein n=1 Tax=Fusarium austroafricanum TaxID=2364996 RepID=A0A8H4NRR8_9HYPO|nr:hypothetical protein F53441_7833 [Fusarium austroafricanum]